MKRTAQIVTAVASLLCAPDWRSPKTLNSRSPRKDRRRAHDRL